ncbi:uncharacterized protein IL334_001071 [Kwoniella shivajii]|uniref:Zn(2)-C6 fungal-type domain-containing protein n=1 Tax=Kwoniella shivajii TaxID=564305 RepID=A0ABZ1CS03_9TREE|nr:hypothetical protein IL334_001071 [Kwoniella shivajii]
MSFTPPDIPPPISTLSAALENGTDSSMVIAPELMGEEGLPPSIRRRPSDTENEGGAAEPARGLSSNGYQSSSARDERSGWDNSGSTYNSGLRHTNPWEEGYRDHSSNLQQQQQDQQNESSDYHMEQHSLDNGNGEDNANDNEHENGTSIDKPKPRKRPRTSKPRQSKDNRGDGLKDDGIPEKGVLDYADPSGDIKLGPVYVHPPKGAAQACVRCHKIKRKCDNAKPRCAGCSKADVACVFELSPATASYVTSLKSNNIALASQIATAAERIQHLESTISNLERGLPPPAEGDMYDPSLLQTQADFAAMSKTILSVRSSELSSPVFGGPVSLDALTTNRRPATSDSARTSFGITLVGAEASPLPPYDVSMQALETFFDMNAISYPFLDKDDFLRDMDEIYRRDQSGNRRGSTITGQIMNGDDELWPGKEFILFMVVAIGTTNKERMGEVEKGSSKIYKQRAFLSLNAAVGREDILCVQSLILLAIYAMFDPSGISLWHVVGFAARVAIALNLHRRVDDSSLPANVVEHRKRVFYSLFNLDRLVAGTLSKPLAIADSDIDVEFPTPSPTDAPFRGRPRIEFTRHIIKLRRLGGAILSTVYSVSGEQNSLPEPDRAGIIHSLHSRLDTWLSECPLPPDNNEEKGSMIHTSHSWFLLNYHQGLCLLYRPSPLYPTMTVERLTELHQASIRCVDLYIELWHEQKVSYNLINVSMQFLACISLLYCLCEYDSRDSALVKRLDWRKEVAQRLGQCHDLLDAFSGALPETAKYREIFTKLSGLLLARYGPIKESSTVTSPSNENKAKTDVTSRAIDQVPATNAVLPNTVPITEGANSSTSTNENEIAWNAMTQLWYNSGEFIFDERALNPLSANITTSDQNQDGKQQQQQQQQQQREKERDLGSAHGLWHQLG